MSRRTLILTAACGGYAAVCATVVVRNVAGGAALDVLPAICLATVEFYRYVTAVPGRLAALSWILLIATAAPWQTNRVTAAGVVTVTSGTDAAKLVVTTIAFVLAFMGRSRSVSFPWPVKALLVYASISVLGAFTGPDVMSSLYRSVRLMMVVLAVTWAASRLPRRRLAFLAVLFATAICVFAIVGAEAGLVAKVDGRLGGYIPPLQANDLAIIAASGALCGLVLWMRGELRRSVFAVAIAIALVTLALTESRASIIGLVVALLVLGVPRLEKRGPIIVGIMIAAFTVTVFIQANTSAQPITAALTHNGTTSTTSTLTSRTSEWQSVGALNVTYPEKLFGQGLADKTVPVDLPYTAYASLDGTWPSAYLSAGILGALTLAGAVLVAAWSAWRRRDGFALALIALLLTNSLVEDTFNDVSTSVVLFISLGLANAALERQARARGRLRRRTSSVRADLDIRVPGEFPVT